VAACKDCTRPAEISAWDLCLTGTQGGIDTCAECASKRCLALAEESAERVREKIAEGRYDLARAAADEAGSWLMGAVEAYEAREDARLRGAA